MTTWLKYSFVADLLGALGCIAYGFYIQDVWWWGGGIAGLLFSVVWRQIQPKLLRGMLRKTPAKPAPVALEPLVVEASAPVIDATPVAPASANAAVEPSATDASPAADAAPARRPIAVNVFPAITPKDGRLRYY